MIATPRHRRCAEPTRLRRISYAVFCLKKLLERNRRNAEESLVLVEAGTTLQGVQLLQPSLPVANEVWKFFQKHLAEQGARYPWSDRPNPLGGDD